MYELYDPKHCRDIIEKELGRIMLKEIKGRTYDFNDIVQTKSVQALGEIYKIVNEQDCYSSDFEMVEAILKVFETYGLYSGACHDF